MVLKQQEAEQILKWLKKMMGDAGGSNVCQPDGAVPWIPRHGKSHQSPVAGHDSGMIHADVFVDSSSIVH